MVRTSVSSSIMEFQSSHHDFQNTIISSEYVDFWTKIWLILTVDLETVDYFFPKGHRKQTSNFSFISSLKILGGATKQDVLQFATLRYFLQLYSIFFNLMSSFNLSITYLVCHIQFWLHSTQCLQIMIYQDYTCCFTSCLFWLLWSIKWFMFSQTVSTKKLFKKHSKRILHLGILLKKDLMYSI